MGPNEFYVYLYLDPRKPGDYHYDEFHFDFEPFYVGKGKGVRMNEHINEAKRSSKNSHKLNKIRKILKIGDQPIILMYRKGLREEDSFLLEIDLIRKIGRYDLKLGPLVNLTNGGEGPSGMIVKFSKEANEKISRALMGYKHSIDTRTKMASAKKRKIIQLDSFGKILKEWDSVKDAADKLFISHQNISRCCQGGRNKCGGFVWKYK